MFYASDLSFGAHPCLSRAYIIFLHIFVAKKYRTPFRRPLCWRQGAHSLPLLPAGSGLMQRLKWKSDVWNCTCISGPPSVIVAPNNVKRILCWTTRCLTLFISSMFTNFLHSRFSLYTIESVPLTVPCVFRPFQVGDSLGYSALAPAKGGAERGCGNFCVLCMFILCTFLVFYVCAASHGVTKNDKLEVEDGFSCVPSNFNQLSYWQYRIIVLPFPCVFRAFEVGDTLSYKLEMGNGVFLRPIER